MSTYSPGVSSVDVSEANGQKVEKHPNLQRGGRQAPAHRERTIPQAALPVFASLELLLSASGKMFGALEKDY